jgi:hypothetical protein
VPEISWDIIMDAQEAFNAEAFITTYMNRLIPPGQAATVMAAMRVRGYPVETSREVCSEIRAMEVAEFVTHATITARVLSGSPQDQKSVAIHQERRGWFEVLVYCIPKGFREGGLGDLGEERARWRREGLRRPTIEFRTVSQLLVLIIAALWDDIKETVARSLRTS